ncbi:DUF1150 family protein [Aliiroseovarius crassostreae]|uniref:DUF1150 family protein n=1 Tax=Aliiroseovarius crassostreae TaxID=154981 RepID=UPI003C7B9C9F
MDAKFEFLPEDESRIVYIRAVRAEDLPEEVRPQVEGMERLHSVHSEDGECLAVVNGRRLAFDLARQHDLRPVTVH